MPDTYADGFNVAVKAAAKVLRALAEGDKRELHTVNEWWQHSVDEIALELERLRAIEARARRELELCEVALAKGDAGMFAGLADLRSVGTLRMVLGEEGPRDE